jgi:hypothetical protein
MNCQRCETLTEAGQVPVLHSLLATEEAIAPRYKNTNELSNVRELSEDGYQLPVRRSRSEQSEDLQRRKLSNPTKTFTWEKTL